MVGRNRAIKKAFMAMSFNKDDFLSKLSTLTVAELVELTKALEQSWGVSAIPVAELSTTVVPPPPPPIVPTEFTVMLKNAGANRIGVVRVVRELTGLGLVDARDLVDGAPKPVRTGVSQAEAADIERRLCEAGADVEIKATAA